MYTQRFALMRFDEGVTAVRSRYPIASSTTYFPLREQKDTFSCPCARSRRLFSEFPSPVVPVHVADRVAASTRESRFASGENTSDNIAA